MFGSSRNNKVFLVVLGGLLFISFLVHLFINRGNNLYFTVDQGRDGVFAREILTRRQIFLKGPETNIKGIYAGPLSDYLIALGYFIASGHPFGAALVMILANLIICFVLGLWLQKRIGEVKSLVIVGALAFSWSFFETSLWGFHPFLLVPIAFAIIMFLTEFLKGKGRYFYLSLFFIFLALNVEVAGALALFAFVLVVGLFGVIKGNISFKKYLLIAIILPIVGGLIFAHQFVFGLLRPDASPLVNTAGNSAGRVFSGTSATRMLDEFTKIIASATIPQNAVIGVLTFIIIVILFLKYGRKIEKDVRRFVFLSLVLTLVSYIFFASNAGWRSWHTVYLAPVLFVAALLIVLNMKKKVKLIFLLIPLLLFQITNFANSFKEYLLPNSNPSLLYNEIAAVDWIYKEAADQGFRVYNFTDTFYDFPYQYLFYWHGAKTYGYLPDEYSNFPLSFKGLYVPGFDFYANPKRSGEDLKYLIIQSQTNGEANSDWPDKFKKYHTKIGEKQIGDITIEKYLKNHDAPNDLCIWWDECL